MTVRDPYSDRELAEAPSPPLPSSLQAEEGWTKPVVAPLPQIVHYDVDDPEIRAAATAFKERVKAEARKRRR
jgi:hypothetical protein